MVSVRCESHTSGSEFVNSERCAATVAHVIGVLNETGSLGRVSRRRVVDRHMISRPDLRARDARSYPRNWCDLFIGLNICFSSGIVTGYDASYIHCHCISPSLPIAATTLGDSVDIRSIRTAIALQFVLVVQR